MQSLGPSSVFLCVLDLVEWACLPEINHSECTRLRSADSNVSGNRCQSDCRHRGREFDELKDGTL